MNKQFKKIGVVFVAVGSLVHLGQAEFGVGVGSSFNCDANFSSSSQGLPQAGGAGAAVAGVDHIYDDGFNRVDSSGNAGGLTSFWGYDDASQYDASGTGTLTFNGTLSTATSRGAVPEKGRHQPTIMVYWQDEFTEKEEWSLGFRAALRWQDINIKDRAGYATLDQDVTDVYQLNNVIPPAAPFVGSYTGPNALIGDAPTRTVNGTTAGGGRGNRRIDAYMLALDLGPTLSLDLTEEIRLVGKCGGTMAWLHGKFTYSDGSAGRGSDSETEILYGLFAGADLQYQMDDNWGVFAGLNYNYLEDIQFEAEGRHADLDFDGHTFMFGLYYR